ncbi:MAG: hypothetical protein U0M66_00490 [Bacilli bacterium]|nr:hypothetical protein [Bacilli bacterium]
MKLRKIGKKSLAFLIINTVLIIYIFTISIGYSFLSKSLNISGTASTYNPKLDFSPFEIVQPSFSDPDYRTYFFNYNFNNLDKFGAANEVWGRLWKINSFDNDYKTYNQIIDSIMLFPNDPNNTIDSSLHFDEFLLNPIYIVFKNITSYPLDNFYVTEDTLNSSVADFPTNSLKIKMFKVSNIEEILEISNNDEYDNSGWSSISQDAIDYDLCVSNKCNFKTETVGIDEFLVLGLYFEEIKDATTKWRTIESLLLVDSIPDREDDGISLKFWDAKFSENSAIKIRIAFLDENKFYNDLGQISALSNYYDKPSSFHHSVDWWYQP